ncbi:Transducin beta-like protein 3, partial [Cryptotermes secundus]
VLDIEQGRVTTSVGVNEEDSEDTINTFSLSPDNEKIISNHRSGLLKLWNWRDGSLVKQWKSIHKGPVSQLAFSKDGVLLASGGTDSSIRIWDLQHQACTHNLRGAQGVISVVQFYSNMVFAAGDDAVIRAWNYSTGRQQLALSGHFSKVTALVFHEDTNQLLSCGRDRVIILWDLPSGTTVRTLPVFEGLEGLVLLPPKFRLPGFKKKVKGGIHVAAAGERGVVRIWEVTEGLEVFTQSNSLVSKATEEGGLAIVQLLFNVERCSLAIISADHNIIIHQLATFVCEKQLVGFSDEVLDLALLGTGGCYLAVATNSTDIKLYNMKDMGCQLLRGHTDLVLTLAAAPSNPSLLLSGAKDNSVRLWLMDPESHAAKCVGVGSRHTLSVGSVALSQLSASFFLSVSQDLCLKLWKIPKKLNSDEVQILNVDVTEIAHDKDINSVSVSPNDKLIATGSQDKTAKLWSVEGLTLLGVLRGHRRGVWCVRFSPVDQVVLSSSADCTIKLWAVSDLTCVKTFEGHDSSVLRAEFISQGMQLITAGADGLLKLWNIKTSECMTTLDDHDGRIWALAVSRDESLLISGGSDSNLVLWRDVTEKRREEAEEARQKLILEEQELANLVKSDQLLSALKLALTLDRPLQVLRIIQEVLKQGQEGLQDTVRQLESDQKAALLKNATVWNCNSKNCHPAQLVISILLDDLSSGDLKIQAFSNMLEGTLPYTERHFKRLTQLLQDLHLLQFTAACMQPQLQGGGSVLK